MTRQQERVWRKKIDDAEAAVLQLAVEWCNTTDENLESRLREAVRSYKSVREGK